MHTLPIPNTDLTPSALCLGTGGLGGDLDQATSFAMLDAFREAGGNFLDSAKVYADWLPGERSSSEKTIGRYLKARGCRDEMIIATKGAHPDLAAMHIPRMSPAEIVADCEASLTHLGVERIDLYYLHRDDPTRPVEEIVDTLEGLRQAGKLRYYGCSNWRPNRIWQSMEYARTRGIPGFVVDQPLWSLAKVEYANLGDPTLAVMDAEMFDLHRQTVMACAPFSSQANGFFQKMDSGQAERLSEWQRTMYATPENLARLERLRELKRQTGLSTTQIVLGYLMAQPFAVFPIVGPHSLEQLQDTLSAADVRLTVEQVEKMEHPQPPTPSPLEGGGE